jgi:hypothetical protein
MIRIVGIPGRAGIGQLEGKLLQKAKTSKRYKKKRFPERTKCRNYFYGNLIEKRMNMTLAILKST